MQPANARRRLWTPEPARFWRNSPYLELFRLGTWNNGRSNIAPMSESSLPKEPARRPSSLLTASPEELLGDDWPVRAADSVERLIGSVRSKTTGPALVISRVLVYGVVAAVLALIALILVLALVTRLMIAICQGEVWLAYLILGVMFAVAGLLLWGKVPKS